MARPPQGPPAWPSQPMLAKAVEELPRADALRGGCQYEPKWDGYRGLVAVFKGRAQIRSRNGTDLTQAFVDVARAAEEQLQDGTLLDGELVVWHGDGLDFSQLQRRVIAPTRAASYARELPASFVAFDLLAVEGEVLTDRPLRARREQLDDLGVFLRPPLQIAPATTDLALAEQWLADNAAAKVGIEGLVIKALETPFLRPSMAVGLAGRAYRRARRSPRTGGDAGEAGRRRGLTDRLTSDVLEGMFADPLNRKRSEKGPDGQMMDPGQNMDTEDDLR